MCLIIWFLVNVFWETRLLIIHFFFLCPGKPFSCKETLPRLDGAMILESTYWHDWSTNTTGEKGGVKLLGRMGCFSGRLFALKLNSVQRYKQLLRKPSWKCLKITVSLTAILETEHLQWERQMSLAAFSTQCVISARVCSLSVQGSISQPGPCEGRTNGFFVQRGPSVLKIKWWPYTALVQTFFWGREQTEKGYAKKQEAMCSGGRIRFAKVPTFVFPTNSCSMQTKFPFAKLPGPQCCRWFKLTGCT